MIDSSQNIIPILTTEAGSCLTAANWHDVGVNTVTYYLDTLLLKPGLPFLSELSNLNNYLGWSGSIILNASNLTANREGIFTVISPYDGSKSKFTYSELIGLIKHLKPHAVILPPNCLKHIPNLAEGWDESIFPFIGVDDVAINLKSFGMYFTIKNEDSDNTFAEWGHKARYVMGEISGRHAVDLKSQGIDFIETDSPAKLALLGTVYSGQGLEDLSSNTAAMNFTTIDASCKCPTCSQQFTKAYLHHLYHHTPLLCQRFLLQHNIYNALIAKPM